MDTPGEGGSDRPDVRYYGIQDWPRINALFEELGKLGAGAVVSLVSVTILRLIRAGGMDEARLQFGDTVTCINKQGLSFWRVERPGYAVPLELPEMPTPKDLDGPIGERIG